MIIRENHEYCVLYFHKERVQRCLPMYQFCQRLSDRIVGLGCSLSCGFHLIFVSGIWKSISKFCELLEQLPARRYGAAER